MTSSNENTPPLPPECRYCATREAPPPMCRHCETRATCVGEYERTDHDIGFACDECCGHGNEDGWCIPICDADGWMSTVSRAAATLRDELDKAEARTAEAIAAWLATRAAEGRSPAWLRDIADLIRAGAWRTP